LCCPRDASALDFIVGRFVLRADRHDEVRIGACTSRLKKRGRERA
jgi:hypothetical protein